MDNSGQLNRYVEVQQIASGSGGNTYTKLRDQWVGIEPIRASKRVFLSAQGSTVTHVITAREKPALAVGNRLVYRGQNYLITAVQTHIGDRQECEAEVTA